MPPLFLLQKKFSRNKKKEKDNNLFLLKNSELLLERSITSCSSSAADFKSSINPIRIFSEIELNEATNNFQSDRLLYDHGPCSVFYKGIIHQDRGILICKLKEEPEGKIELERASIFAIAELEDVIVEIVALSQINHKNIVKLLGCCLETFYPIQVYEFCFDTVLHDQIHEKDCLDDNPNDTSNIQELLSWENRLRVATEIADAITYLHIANSRPVVHRDISSKNVFLDENCVAKLFDLSNSVLIPFGKTHGEVYGGFTGTYGYMAPDSMETDQVSVKTDVYSFGVLLLELLTGCSPYSVHGCRKIKSYVNLESNIVDDCVKIWEVNGIGIPKKQQLQAFAVLAVRCTRTSEEERPTMIVAAKELRQIKRV